MRWLAHVLGLDSATGAAYLFWSGFGSVVIGVGFLGNAYALLRKHNCHARRCVRISRFPVPGTPYTVCRRHSPEPAPRAAAIAARYHLYLGRQPGRG